MPSTFSPNLRIELIGSGEQSGVWGNTTNNNLGDLIEQAISGATTLDVSVSDFTLSALNGVTDQSRSAVLIVTGTPGTTRTLTIPNVNKAYTVKNRSNSTVNIKTATGVAYALPSLSEAYIYCDGNNVITGRTITDGANTFTSNPAPLNNTALTGVPTAPTAPAGTNTTQIATTAFVTTALPVGSVIMWYGSLGAIPTGWALCNGASGTPDLRDRFVVGAGSSYALGATGGANTVTLTTNEIPSHTHTGTTANANISHTHTFTTGTESQSHTHAITVNSTSTAHAHTFSATTSATDLSHAHTGSGTTSNNNVDHVHGGTTAGANRDHSHTYSGTTGAQNANHTHSGTTSTVGDHVHGQGRVPFGASSGNNPAFGSLESNTLPAGAHNHTFTSGIESATHGHAFSGTTSGISQTHEHAFTTGGQSTAHTHTYSFTTSTFSGNHNHTVSGTTSGMSANDPHSHTASSGNASQTHTHSGTTAATDPVHAHTFTTNATGGGQAHENRPPYFALFYIMRV